MFWNVICIKALEKLKVASIPIGGCVVLVMSLVLFSPKTLSTRLTILYTNDFHGRYIPIEVAPGSATSQTGDPGGRAISFDRTGKIGGFAYLSTLVQERQAHGPLLLVHGGDTFSDDLLGNLTRGEVVIQLMNALGYDFMALGNHDFDYGLERTQQLQALADFPMRAANILVEATGQPVLGAPVKVMEIADLKVGLLALGYHNTPLTTSRELIRGLSFTSGIEAARPYVQVLRQRADLVIVVSHQGMAVDQVLARQVPGIDVIIGGHSHDWIAPPHQIGGTYLVQALSDGTLVGELVLESEEGHEPQVEAHNYPLWNDKIAADPALVDLIKKWRQLHRPYLEAVIATAIERIDRQYKSQSPFDTLVGDILREETGAEIALLPGVGYGVSLTPGPITREQLYTLLPHPVRMVRAKLIGRQILDILEQSAINLNPRHPLELVGGLIQTSGMSWTVDLDRPRGQRIQNVRIGEASLEPMRSYSVVTHTGMLEGLHRYEAIGQGTEIHRYDRLVVDIVEAWMGRQGQVKAPPGGQIRLISKDRGSAK
ncbi:bifunctional metallophosphatase/5'-nucleotidase [Nitrosococcus wardiae]|nr:bifunctional UDP-sugar hydrolase/5'-nucleotidase [Nitrosococcus wardiae]